VGQGLVVQGFWVVAGVVWALAGRAAKATSARAIQRPALRAGWGWLARDLRSTAMISSLLGCEMSVPGAAVFDACELEFVIVGARRLIVSSLLQHHCLTDWYLDRLNGPGEFSVRRRWERCNANEP